MLKRYHIRYTRPRREIAEVIVTLPLRHFSVEGLLKHIRKNRRNISRATTYRTVELFARKGLLKTVDLGKGCRMYEVSEECSHHDHLYCVECGAILEFEDARIERCQEKVCNVKQFLPLQHTLRITGVCRDCRRKGASSHEEFSRL
jgi:Fur family ferric uptake transcriptional regulator